MLSVFSDVFYLVTAPLYIRSSLQLRFRSWTIFAEELDHLSGWGGCRFLVGMGVKFTVNSDLFAQKKSCVHSFLVLSPAFLGNAVLYSRDKQVRLGNLVFPGNLWCFCLSPSVFATDFL